MQKFLLDNKLLEFARRRFVPKSLRDWVKSQRTMTARPDMPEDVKSAMMDQFIKDRSALAQIFPNHPALTLCYPFANGTPT